ncbi:MAG: metal-sulfur cluster assembly factor [Candidatus Bathyarchaeia archaeon]
MSNDALLKVEIEKALKKVVDPEIGSNLVDLGMIKKVTVENGVARIEMVLTTPLCPLMNVLPNQVKMAAEEVKGVKKAEVAVVGYGLP